MTSPLTRPDDFDRLMADWMEAGSHDASSGGPAWHGRRANASNPAALRLASS